MNKNYDETQVNCEGIENEKPYEDPYEEDVIEPKRIDIKSIDGKLLFSLYVYY